MSHPTPRALFQVVFDRARKDEHFRQNLAKDPAKTLRASGLKLSDSDVTTVADVVGGSHARNAVTARSVDTTLQPYRDEWMKLQSGK